MTYELRFLDGPAQGEKIMLSVPPTQRRWFCRMRGDGEQPSWWYIDAPPPADSDVEVTVYETSGHAPRKDGALVTYAAVETWVDEE